MEKIPTPQQFKDAIESLSPEQQRFCKAFRSMELEHTLLGICVLFRLNHNWSAWPAEPPCGELSIRSASLHVVIASTHCFDKTLIDTIVQDNVNPIEKVEKSSLMIASTIHDLPIAELVNESQIERLRTHSAISFEE